MKYAFRRLFYLGWAYMLFLLVFLQMTGCAGMQPSTLSYLGESWKAKNPYRHSAPSTHNDEPIMNQIHRQRDTTCYTVTGINPYTLEYEDQVVCQ